MTDAFKRLLTAFESIADKLSDKDRKAITEAINALEAEYNKQEDDLK